MHARLPVRIQYPISLGPVIGITFVGRNSKIKIRAQSFLISHVHTLKIHKKPKHSAHSKSKYPKSAKSNHTKPKDSMPKYNSFQSFQTLINLILLQTIYHTHPLPLQRNSKPIFSPINQQFNHNSPGSNNLSLCRVEEATTLVMRQMLNYWSLEYGEIRNVM